jgi:hypothetical protein
MTAECCIGAFWTLRYYTDGLRPEGAGHDVNDHVERLRVRIETAGAALGRRLEAALAPARPLPAAADVEGHLVVPKQQRQITQLD